MTPFAELVDPFDVTAREWVIELEPQGIHPIARRRLFLRSLPSGTYQAAGRLPGIPPGTTRVLDLEQLSHLLESESLEKLRRPNLIKGSLLSDLLGEFVAAHRADGISLTEALRMLEGVTQTLSPTPKSEKKLAKKARNVTLLEALVTLGPGIADSRRRWKEQLLHSWERNCQLLQNDEVIKRELETVRSQGQQMRFALRALVDRDERLSLGTWSCQLSKGEWDRLWHNPRWRSNTPSEWAEELLVAKARSHTRAIKEQLARERKERNIEASWAAYGQWLSDHPQAVRDIEFLLGGLPIRIPTAGVIT